MKKILTSIAISILPLTALAQVTTFQGGGVPGLLKWFQTMLALVVPIIISLAVVWFIWSVFAFVLAGSEEGKTKAKTNMIWGIVAIFVMVSVWGLVGLLGSTFNLNNSVIQAPGIQQVQ